MLWRLQALANVCRPLPGTDSCWKKCLLYYYHKDSLNEAVKKKKLNHKPNRQPLRGGSIIKARPLRWAASNPGNKTSFSMTDFYQKTKKKKSLRFCVFVDKLSQASRWKTKNVKYERTYIYLNSIRFSESWNFSVEGQRGGLTWLNSQS